MLSLQQAIEIRESILAYLKATFTFQDKAVHQAFYDFVTHPTEGIFKGPYLSLKLPFVKAHPEETLAVPLDIKPDWVPYDHQVKSWHRLSTQEQIPQPTIVTTGTGSGKTESFMYPMLDYCYQNLHRKGIKVIILYPMNALATDQARRLAQAIHHDHRLRDKVTAGLFIGEGKNAAQYPKNMGVDHIIENRGAILDSPPDILLTNFKMLDYGLMKADYHDLWTGNLQDHHLLQFLVLDELHTYDGAQGTDVANLIRRLKLKLGLETGHLCPVGTSATIGSGKDAPALLSAYASRIFGENVGVDAIIGENRQQPAEFFDETLSNRLPNYPFLKKAFPLPHEDYPNYIERLKGVWQVAGDLAGELKRLQIVKDLVTVINTDEGIKTLDHIVQKLAQVNVAFRNDIPEWDSEQQFYPKQALVQSLFSLIAEAKVTDASSGRTSPFLFSQTQLWVRELSGVVRMFDKEPRFGWKNQPLNEQGTLALPPWFCRECGASGWLAIKHDNKERFERDVQEVYNQFFGNHKNIYFVNLTDWFSQADAAETGYEADDQLHRYIDQQSLEFYTSPKDTRVDITAFRKINQHKRADHVCPECNSRNTLAIVGTRTATLSSLSVSQVLSSDLDAQNEQQRKVLAFTNAVQDAAHQAGFIEARNYRFTFRASLQKVINAQNKAIPLHQLADAFIDYWKTQADETGQYPLAAYYYRFYPKDYLGKSSPEDYKKNQRFEPHFQAEFDQRIRWEVYSEFGYNALIGRTLEKTGASAVFFAPEASQKVWHLMAPWLDQNDVTHTITEAKFKPYLLLLLNRVRTRGAISHPYFNKFRENDLKRWDLNWQNDGRHFLNRKFGSRTRLPRLLTPHKDTRNVLDSTFTTKRNWFHVYFAKMFPMASVNVDFVNEFYAQLIDALQKIGIVDHSQTKAEVPSYALKADNLHVVNRVEVLECKQCGHQVYTGRQATDMVEGKCLNYRCKGTYVLLAKNQPTIAGNYYQLVYNRNRSPRIYATEHTGLLERKKREIIENDFKQRLKFNSKNAMVATSTLEMGIDIGSLNTAFNNSVPPLPSNFLQRVGRAGRASGGALIVNFAQSKAHDLFYYQEPLDMMAGEVNTPGCYLEAQEILRRHFFAFCIDSWTTKAPSQHYIPSLVRYLKIESSDPYAPEFFINQILNFTKASEAELLAKFTAQYGQEVGTEVFAKLEASLQNEQFYTWHKGIFARLKDEIKHIRQQIADTQRQVTQLKLANDDPENITLRQEIKNMQGIIASIKKRHTLEHLTNVGVLPNYAFPETGVLLNASVLGNKAEESSQPPLNKTFEIVRSANQAIREFAPDNYFYSQGFRFEVTGVNTFDWSDQHNFHQKRFCSHCDHIDIAEVAPKGSCPKCGHESWGSNANVHSFAKLLSVKSFNNQAQATLNDANDERESIIYQVLKHFKFHNNTSIGAWAMREIPFGIEFVKNVTITETNLGRTDVINARRVSLNETEVPTHGFVTCKHCGKSSSNINSKDHKFHYGFCKYRDDKYNGTANDIYEEVFFFREMESEALKILLPVQEFESEASINMFRAGIELGLKKYFAGNPQHLAMSNYREYNKQTQRFDRYLVLYDTIPGGTGYLEKLFDWKNFNQLLHIAYEEIKECGCQHQGKDGCYRCIYSYQNQYLRQNLSREKAEKHFARIVSQCEGWESLPHGLTSVTNTGQIEESELEDRFIRSLKTLAKKETAWSFAEVNQDGKINYTLAYANSSQNTHLGFHIRPQVFLSRNEGVAFATRTDFLMSCTEACIKGQKITDLSLIPQIAVYMDGYQYHASSNHNNFENDFKKRQAINNATLGNYATWTLTWNDLEQFDQRFDQEKQHNRSDFLYDQLLEPGFAKTSASLRKNVGKANPIELYEAYNNFERLLKFLQFPLPNNKHFIRGWALYLGSFHAPLLVPSYPSDELMLALDDTYLQTAHCKDNKTLDGWLRFRGTQPNDMFELKTMVNLGQNEVVSKLDLLQTQELDKFTWNKFWSLYNLIQFFPINDFTQWNTQALPTSQPPSTTPSNKIPVELLELFDEVYHPMLQELYNAGELVSEKDEQMLNALLDAKGNVIAEAELIMHRRKEAFEPFSAEDKKVLEEAGYVIKG